MSDLVSQRFKRFCMVGVVGFVVDGGLLWILLNWGFNPFSARLISFPIAVFTTWRLNRAWTFGVEKSSNSVREWTSYLTVQSLGTMLNFGVYALIIRTFGSNAVMIFGAFCSGAVIALFWNYYGARWVLNAQTLKSDEEKPLIKKATQAVGGFDGGNQHKEHIK